MKRLGSSVLLVAALVAAGCSDSAEEGPLDGTWEIVEVDGQSIVPGDNTVSPPYFEIGDGRADGSLGCNDGGAPLDVTERVIDFGALERTEQACDIAVSFAEMALVDVIADGIVEWSRDGDRMIWVAAGRQIVLEPIDGPSA